MPPIRYFQASVSARVMKKHRLRQPEAMIAEPRERDRQRREVDGETQEHHVAHVDRARRPDEHAVEQEAADRDQRPACDPCEYAPACACTSPFVVMKAMIGPVEDHSAHTDQRTGDPGRDRSQPDREIEARPITCADRLSGQRFDGMGVTVEQEVGYHQEVCEQRVRLRARRRLGSRRGG